MEKQIALVSKADKRVVDVLVVDNLDKDYIQQFANNECEVVAVADTTPHINGLYDGKKFIEPTNAHLIQIGLVTPIDVAAQAEAEAKAQAKVAAEGKLAALGLTTDDLRALGL